MSDGQPAAAAVLPARTADPRAPRHARPDSPAGWSRRRFVVAVVVVTTIGLAVRVAYVLAYTRYHNGHLYDDFYYLAQSFYLSHGHFFPQLWKAGPDAAHPPLTALVLTPATYFFGIHPGSTPQRLTMALLGAATVPLVGVLGRQVAGARVGVVAAVLAAFYPNMWIPNGIVMSETLSMLCMVLILLGVYRLLSRPTLAVAAACGVACGLEILTREELALLVPFLVVPAALLAKVPWRRRLTLAGVAVAVTLLVVGPWVGRNLASFKDPTFVSTGQGPVLLGANCPATYNGFDLGSWSLQCSVKVAPAADPSVESARQEHQALTYMGAHLGRLPVVMAARVGRLWDLFRPIQMTQVDVNEGRPVWASLAGLASYYLLVPLGVVGIVVLRRRRRPSWPLLVPAAVLTVVSAVGYGLVRFRAPFEPCLVVLAAVALGAGWERLAGPAARSRADPGVARVPEGASG